MTSPESTTSRRRLYSPINIVVAVMLLALIIMFVANRKRNIFTLSNGLKFRVTYIERGKTHEFDHRTLLGILVDNLPRSLARKLNGDFGEWLKIGRGTVDTVGVAFKPVDEITKRHSRDYFAWTLADDNGWYFSPIFPSDSSPKNVENEIFQGAPRSPKTLTILFYDDFKKSTATAIGSWSFSNPGRRADLAKLPVTLPPETVKSGKCKLKNLKLFTGIYVADEPRYQYNRFFYQTAASTPDIIEKLIQGIAVRASAPQHARSALIFKPLVDEKNIALSLRNASILVTDSLGQAYSRTVLSKLFHTTDTCVLLFDSNLPLTDGNYRFDLTLYEDPQPDSTSWKTMRPIIPSHRDWDSTRTLELGPNHIEAGMTDRKDLINLTSTEDSSLLAMRACISETSAPISISPLQDGRKRNTFQCYSKISQSVTSGTVTLSFAETIQHKLTFSGIPTRPD